MAWLGPLLAALAFRDDAVFLNELVGRLLEGRADVVKDACTQAPLEREVPFLGGLAG
jgi:hypothetical protein